ncbi:MAG: barstar family protein [Oscillospiraceae bacterium]|nr:barstar family protein [Oscillospiraceae bacterium]MBQ7129605.1 barstar family protein [Oscillospiraceae bacterium]
MKDITIDCRGFVPRSDLHKAFADALAFPDYYGNNLDALHDCLTEISEETRIRLLHWEDAEASLGSYARATKRAILDAALENTQLAVMFD